FQIAAVGAGLIALGIASMLIQFGVSFLKRDKLRDVTGDPWGGRTLEWSTSSPPPAYNFAFTPRVHENDTWEDMKRNGYQRPLEGFTSIHMPKNTAAGFIISAMCGAMGFFLIWQMWLLAGLTFAAVVIASIIHTFNYKRYFYIPAEEVSRTEEARTRLLESHV